MITDEHVDAIRRDGYVVVEDLLTPEELTACRADVARYLPSAEELAAAPGRYRNLNRFAHFPFAGDALNRVATHPEIISFAERLLGTTELQLAESILQAKYGKRSGSGPDQQLHTDAWGKNSLVYPRDDGIFCQLFMIVYYSDVTEDLGPTYVVSQQHTRDMFLLPNARPRDEYPHLYEVERPVLGRAGMLLAFTARTLHRGSAVRAEVGERFVQFVTYHAAAARWAESQNWPGAPPDPNAPEMRRFIERATPRQREMVGFPPPGHAYWNEETLIGVAARYPGLDMTPYRNAMTSCVSPAS